MEKNYILKTLGFTLIELLIVIGMIGAIAGIVMVNFSSYRDGQSLSNDTDEVVSLINEARSRTLAGEGGQQYGVHFESGRVVLFSGTTFVDGLENNKVVSFEPSVTMSSISLTGGVADEVFKKLTGDTDQNGTLIMQRVSTTLGEKTITISQNGSVSVN